MKVQVSAEFLKCGVTEGAAVFWLCNVLRVSVWQPFPKLKQEPWVGGQRAGRVSCWHHWWYLVGTGSGGIGHLPQLPVAHLR